MRADDGTYSLYADMRTTVSGSRKRRQRATTQRREGWKIWIEVGQRVEREKDAESPGSVV